MFVVKGFEWDKGNADKNFIKHNVTTMEAEEVFFTSPVILKVQDNLYYIYSRTLEGRYLFSVFLVKPDRIIRIISIRDMDEKEKRFYKRKRGGN